MSKPTKDKARLRFKVFDSNQQTIAVCLLEWHARRLAQEASKEEEFDAFYVVYIPEDRRARHRYITNYFRGKERG